MTTEPTSAAREMTPKGGWETCLLEPPTDDATCIVCYDVMIDPMQACSNGHMACAECFDAHLASPAGGKCPGGCGEAIDRQSLEPATKLAAKIASLAARCKNAHTCGNGEGAASEGTAGEEQCGWTGRFTELLPHLRSTCPLELVDCPYARLGCREPVRRRDLEAHLGRAALRHMELASSTIASLSGTVATLESTVQTLQEQVGLARQQLSGAVPKLIEIKRNEALEGAATLPEETEAFLGLYRLDEGARVNDMPLWVHCEDPRRCIAFNKEHSFWHAQRRSEAGRRDGMGRGWRHSARWRLMTPDGAHAMPPTRCA